MDLVLEQIDHYGPGTLVLIQWYWYNDTEHGPGTGTVVLEDSDNEPGTGERRQGRIPLSSPPSGKTAFLSGERFILVLGVQEKVRICHQLSSSSSSSSPPPPPSAAAVGAAAAHKYYYVHS